MALRDASNDASVGGQPPGSAAKLRELQSRCVSTDRPIDRSTDRARVVTRRAAFEWRPRRLTVCLPLDARAREGWIECDG